MPAPKDPDKFAPHEKAALATGGVFVMLAIGFIVAIACIVAYVFLSALFSPL